MQYQVLLDPARIYGYHLTVPQVTAALAANNANAGGGFYSQGGQFYYVRGIGLVRNTDDIGNVVVGAVGVIMTEPVGALVALKLTHTPFSVSSVLGLLALLGVSVETAVILVSYINKLRNEGLDIRTATRQAAFSSHHDDRTGCLPRALAGCPVNRHRLRHTKAFCHRHRGRADLPPVYRFLRQPRALRDGRP
jgi:Cu/Ag efflux pump CusA